MGGAKPSSLQQRYEAARYRPLGAACPGLPGLTPGQLRGRLRQLLRAGLPCSSPWKNFIRRFSAPRGGERTKERRTEPSPCREVGGEGPCLGPSLLPAAASGQPAAPLRGRRSVRRGRELAASAHPREQSRCSTRGNRSFLGCRPLLSALKI